LNQAELATLPAVFPDLAQVRQQQLDWCISRVIRLELSYDCLAKRVGEPDGVQGPAAISRQYSLPIGDFELYLYDLSSDAVTLWAEYWESIMQSALQSISDSINRDSHAIAGLALPSPPATQSVHYFVLTGTPLDKPVSMSISGRPEVGFKPTLIPDAGAPAIKVKPYLEIGRTAVPANRFEKMQIGGLLVLRSSVADGVLANARVLLSERQCLFAVSWNFDEGTILVTDTQVSSADEDDNKANTMSDSALTIPIFAQIELQSVDLETLKSIKEEDTLQAGVLPKDAVVKLSAGGVAFGEGLLVQIDGRLAVRITKLNRRSA
jgi:flagellar motor switch/type III secretory pathway protein FliN